jgi:Zn finger protein HypA/HybF involved in hydrogenase expression
MHEYSIVDSIVASMIEAIKKQHVTKMTSVRFKRGGAFSKEALARPMSLCPLGRYWQTRRYRSTR